MKTATGKGKGKNSKGGGKGGCKDEGGGKSKGGGKDEGKGEGEDILSPLYVDWKCPSCLRQEVSWRPACRNCGVWRPLTSAQRAALAAD